MNLRLLTTLLLLSAAGFAQVYRFLTDAIIFDKIGAVYDVSDYPGSDLGTKLHNCGVAATAIKGTCDASSITGTQTLNNQQLSDITGVTFKLGSATITCTPPNGQAECWRVRSNTRIIGNGRTIIQEPRGMPTSAFYRAIAVQPGSSGVELAGFNCVGGNNYSARSNQQQHCIFLHTTANPYIHDIGCNTLDWNGDCITVYGGSSDSFNPITNLRIERVTIGNIQHREGIALSGVDGADVDTVTDYGSGANTVHLEPDTARVITRHIKIRHVFSNPAKPGPYGCLSATSQNATQSTNDMDILIEDNQCFGTEGIYVTGYTGVRVSHNRVLETVKRTAGGAALQVTAPESIVADNEVAWNATTATQPGLGIQCRTATCTIGTRSGNTVTRNRVKNAYLYGIFASSVPHSTFTGNVIDGVTQKSGKSFAFGIGVNASDTDDYDTISGNTITDTKASPATQYAYYVNSGSNNIITASNIIQNMQSGTYYGNSKAHLSNKGQYQPIQSSE